MKKTKSSLPYYYNLVWVDQNVLNEENTVYRKVFKDLGFSKFHAFESIYDLTGHLETGVQDNILVISSGALAREMI